MTEAKNGDEACRLRRRIADLEEKLDEAVKRTNRMHRRCQSAESGLAQKLERDKRAGWSFGRSLANSGARMFWERVDEAAPITRELAARLVDGNQRSKMLADELVEALDGGPSWRRVKAEELAKTVAVGIAAGLDVKDELVDLLETLGAFA